MMWIEFKDDEENSIDESFDLLQFVWEELVFYIEIYQSEFYHWYMSEGGGWRGGGKFYSLFKPYPHLLPPLVFIKNWR